MLDVGEAALELGVGAAERRFRIGIDVTREIDQRKHQIARLSRKPGLVAVIERSLDLVGFFANFLQDGAGIIPVKADRRRLAACRGSG